MTHQGIFSPKETKTHTHPLSNINGYDDNSKKTNEEYKKKKVNVLLFTLDLFNYEYIDYTKEDFFNK